jgi:hypothetical protein
MCQTDITRTWFGMVGPGVRVEGRNDDVFSDHTDLRRTIISLLGSKDDYIHDGRVLVEKLETSSLPDGLRQSRGSFIDLARLYKQINAPLGSVGSNSLIYANRSISGLDYPSYLSMIGDITSTRNQLASDFITLLNGAAFDDQPVREQQRGHLVNQAQQLIARVQSLADNP